MDVFRRDGLRFDVRDTGPPGAEAVVLLHGFPQTSTSWAAVTPLLNAAGLRTLAPDQRGYSPGARPRDVDAYRMDELVADVVALIEACGTEPVRLVGHDWGSAVAWNLAARRPDLVRSLTAICVGHPAAFAASLRSSGQGLRSWYMAAFQTRLPEAVTDPAHRRGRDRFVAALVRTGQAVPRARRDALHLGVPGAYTAALSWYRAARRDGAAGLPGRVLVPTTLLWGSADVALGFEGVRRTTAYVAGPYRLDVLPGAGHWIPEDAPAAVAAAVLSTPVAPGTPPVPDPVQEPM